MPPLPRARRALRCVRVLHSASASVAPPALASSSSTQGDAVPNTTVSSPVRINGASDSASRPWVLALAIGESHGVSLARTSSKALCVREVVAFPKPREAACSMT
ncbi:MAG: hypothetical protein RL385_1778 [Pseudomonadota bacterium]